MGERFPASNESVISIRATNTYGKFLDSNPPKAHDREFVYGTLGLQVTSASIHSDDEVRSGTSVSTAIAVGIAAQILDFASNYRRGNERDKMFIMKKIKTKEGMLSIFRKLSTDMGHGHFYLGLEVVSKKGSEDDFWAKIVKGKYMNNKDSSSENLHSSRINYVRRR